MKTRVLECVMIYFLVLGICGSVEAVDDTSADNLVQNVDIHSASVVTYDKDYGPEEIPRFAKIGIEMVPGSHLPAAIVWDFDVDNDTATGGSSLLTRTPNGICGGQVCKTPAGDGFDFFIVLTLRTQGDSSTLAACNGCSGSPFQCATPAGDFMPL